VGREKKAQFAAVSVRRMAETIERKATSATAVATPRGPRASRQATISSAGHTR
jgi:hypothetical protein